MHLNFALREPLVPDGPLPDDDSGRAGGRPWVTRPRAAGAPPQAVLDGLRAELEARPHAVLVAGRAERDPRLGAALAAFAERAAIPLLADPLSGARRGPAAIAHYDALLRDPDWAPHAAARAAGRRPADLQAAARLAARPGRGAAGRVRPRERLAGPRRRRGHDPRRRPARHARGASTLKPRDGAWLERWHRADRAAAAAIARALAPAGLSEPRVAAELGSTLPAEATVVVASSMPVRDVETFFPARESPPRVLANRGANGIDGTVSTAFGVATVADGPVVLLIGDVALIHDLGGLIARHAAQADHRPARTTTAAGSSTSCP